MRNHAKALKTCFDGGKLIRMLGGRRKKKLSGPVSRKIEKWRREMFSEIHPKISYCVRDIESRKRGGIVLDGGLELRGLKLSKGLKDAKQAVCFVATLGPEVDSEIAQCTKENRYSDGYILDAMGSVGVECIVDRFHRRMEEKFNAEGKSVTLRFSPGYCDFPLKEQEKLFGIFDADVIGVELTDSYLMVPGKSVSGVFGVTDGVRTLPPYNPCGECPKTGCIARRS